MSPRATVSAPANIAFVKYWGAREPGRALPYHPSISMTLEVCRSTTTVEVDSGLEADRVFIADEAGRLTPADAAFAGRVRGHLAAIRRALGCDERFRVATRNSFPAAAGLASSASGFAALAAAASGALGLHPTPEELSVLARLSGSGSAARSVRGGFVEWPAGDDPEAPAAEIAPASHWPLVDLVALVETGPKEVSSLEGHRRAPTSPGFEPRLARLPGRLAAVRRAIADRDLEALGPLLERDTLELHAVAMTSEPPILYWRPGTLEVLHAVRALRRNGTAAHVTMDAGANVHVICEALDEDAVARRLAELPAVRGVIADRVGSGPRPESVDLLAPAAPGESPESGE